MIRKKVIEVSDRPVVLEIVLDNDKFPKHYDLVSGIPKALYGTVSLIVDEDNYVKCFVNKSYEFLVKSTRFYSPSGACFYHICLTLPKQLVNDYAIDAGMGIELILNEINRGGQVERIFSERMEEGSFDFEPKERSGEFLGSPELLITTKFTDKFYDALALQVNSAFRIHFVVVFQN
jgi:hypothetical protein